MTILGIETSCDDTGIAVLEITEEERPRFSFRSNIVASQVATHQKYGGVFPSLAKREHMKNLPIVLEKALALFPGNLDAIAVTYGPGLSPCLWAGINFAKDLAKQWNVPLVPVDHMEGHFLVGLLKQTNENDQFSMFNDQEFPAVALIVSGGHTQLMLVKGIGEYQMLGETRDDAAGEAFDKTARILGLPYPGGPAIAREAAQWKPQIPNPPPAARPQLDSEGGQLWRAGKSQTNSKFQIPKIKLPRPMLHTKDYDFSFSGLKTAVLYDYKARPKEVRESKEYIQEMAAEIQQAIIDVLLHKTMNAAKEYGAKSVILGGGVSANDSLRTHLKNATGVENIEFLVPPKNLSTDNGAMIALAGYFTYLRDSYEKNPEQIAAAPNLRLALTIKMVRV